MHNINPIEIKMEEFDDPDYLSFDNIEAEDFNSMLQSLGPIHPNPLSNSGNSSAPTTQISAIPSPQTSPVFASKSYNIYGRLDVKHKPRGSKGQWFKIEKGNRIRVDKRKGKLLELVLTFPQTMNIDPALLCRSEVKVYLIDGEQGPTWTRELQPETRLEPPSLVLCEAEDANGAPLGFSYYCFRIQFRVRIFYTSRRQSFLVCLYDSSRGNLLISLPSNEFSSDDNGRPSPSSTSFHPSSLLSSTSTRASKSRSTTTTTLPRPVKKETCR